MCAISRCCPSSRHNVLSVRVQGHPQRRPGQPGAASIYSASTSLPSPWQEHPRTLATFNLTHAFIDRFDGHPRVISEVRLLSGTQPPRPAAGWRRQRIAAAGLELPPPGQQPAEGGLAPALPPGLRDLKLAAPMLILVAVLAAQVMIRQSR